MLCRNRVTDFDRWRSVLASHARAHRDAGLRLLHVWRDITESNNVFFLFEVASVEAAREFVNAPESAEAGREAGVVDGEFHFVNDAGGY